MENDFEVWLKAVFNYGFPSVLALLILVATFKGIRAVWSFLKPRIELYYANMNKFFDTLADNSSKTSEVMSAMSADIRTGQDKTQHTLEEVHSDVKVIRGKMEKTK